MATKLSTVERILEQAAAAGPLSAKKMFGEYALYCSGKLVALVCDDQLFVKPTEAGLALLGRVEEAPPYQGAKPCFLISGERWDDTEQLAALFAATAAELPLPPPKARRGKAKT